MRTLFGASLAALLIGGADAATVPPRPDAVQPNNQNLMDGPAYWTPGQRRLQVPGATANPTQRLNSTLPRPIPPFRPSVPVAPKPGL